MHIQGSFAFNSLSTRPSHPSPSRGFPTGGLALANVNRQAEWRSCAQRLSAPPAVLKPTVDLSELAVPAS